MRALDLLKMVILGALYFALSMAVAGVFSDRRTPILIYPSAGLALAGLMMGGMRLWPGLYLGAVVDGLVARLPLWMFLYEGVGKVGSALAAAAVLRRMRGFDRNLTQPTDYVWLALVGSAGACLSAFTGSTAIMAAKHLTPVDTAGLFFSWWQGDTLGIVLAAPVLLVWRRLPRGWLRGRRSLMTVLCFGLAWLAGQAIFLDWFPTLGRFAFNYWMFLFVAWGAISYGRHGALLICAMTAVQAVLGSLFHLGSFRSDIADTGLLNLWFYMFALTMVGLMLALVIHDRELARVGLAEAKQAAETANALKGEFLANMSHEIRTPMNAILGLSHLALRTELTPKLRDYLTKIQAASRTLLNLINDILDLSKIEAGRLDVESIPFQLGHVIENVSNMVALKADQKGLELVFRVARGTPQGLLGDPLRLGQILLNLTNNAIKFTERGEVVVTIEASGTLPGSRTELQFRVHDTGIGMSAEEQSRIFEAFTQADGSTSRKYGGTGLGLSICRQLVDLMGGEISVASQRGQGSTFSFRLPFGLDTNLGDRQFNTPPGLEKIRVLVVDDHQTARETLEDELTAMRFAVTTVASGRSALSELVRAGEDGEQPYDLVLLDWKMPDLDGLETARRIKSDAHMPKVPVIFVVTGDGRDEIRFQAETLGLQAFLLKPVSPSILFDNIVAAFGQSGGGPSASLQPTELSPVLLAGTRILVAEDNPINQQVVQEMLERLGAQVTLAASGLQAVEALRADATFDLVLMDVQMPVMGGLEATRVIRGELANPIPIIAVTAHALESERQKCAEAGMNDHVAKPIEPLDLVATLLRWIAPSKLERAWQRPAELSDDYPELAGIDVPRALRRLSGNQDLFRDLLREFERSWSEVVPRLRAASGDEARRLAHTLFGASATLGMTEVAAVSQALEQDFSEAGVAALDRALQTVLAGLSQLAAPTVQAAPLDLERAAPLLERLAELLRDHNFEATDVFVHLHGSLAAGPYTEVLERLQGELEMLDFDSALVTLQDLKNTVFPQETA